MLSDATVRNPPGSPTTLCGGTAPVRPTATLSLPRTPIVSQPARSTSSTWWRSA